MPVGEVGLLLRDVLLAVRQHLDEDTHKVRCLLLQHLVVQRPQVDEVACKEKGGSRGSALGKPSPFLWPFKTDELPLLVPCNPLQHVAKPRGPPGPENPSSVALLLLTSPTHCSYVSSVLRNPKAVSYTHLTLPTKA